jgi:hypothetical protein
MWLSVVGAALDAALAMVALVKDDRLVAAGRGVSTVLLLLLAWLFRQDGRRSGQPTPRELALRIFVGLLVIASIFFPH